MFLSVDEKQKFLCAENWGAGGERGEREGGKEEKRERGRKGERAKALAYKAMERGNVNLFCVFSLSRKPFPYFLLGKCQLKNLLGASPASNLWAGNNAC